MNLEQQDGYHLYSNKNYYWYYGIIPGGIAELQSTIAFYEAFINKNSVIIVEESFDQVCDTMSLFIDQVKLHNTLHINSIVNSSNDYTVHFPTGSSVTFCSAGANGNLSECSGTTYGIALINNYKYDPTKYPLGSKKTFLLHEIKPHKIYGINI